MRSPFLIIGVSVVLFSSVSAQQKNIPLNRDNSLWIDRHLSNPSGFHHTAIKPLVESHILLDSLQQEEDKRWKRKQLSSWAGRKIRNENLIIITDEKSDSRITIDPLFYQEVGRENKILYRNTRGILVKGDIGKKLSFSSSFYETQARFPSWVDSFAYAYAERVWNKNQLIYSNTGSGLIPGQGRAKPFRDGYDFGMASGYVSYSPSERINIQAGHGKHFIGEGYRSLLLSDNAFNYPYLRITSSWWKGRLQYTSIYNSMQSLNRIEFATTPEAPFERKAGSFNYLSVAPAKWLQLGLFEGTIWQKWDLDRSIPFDWNYVNPIVGVNTLINGLNGKNNTLLGTNMKINPLKGLVLYSQLAIDDGADEAYQGGMKIFDALGLIKNLHLQIEYNKASSRMYGHKIPLQNYGHYNQPLAHPLGSDFSELVVIVNFKWRDFFARAQYNNAVYTKTGTAFSSGNIFNPEFIYALRIFWPESKLTYYNVELGYLINQNTNMNISAGIKYRNEMTGINTNEAQYLYIAFRTSLTNHYYDF